MNRSVTMTRRLVERFYEDLWNHWDDEAVELTLSAGFDFRGSLGRHTIGLDEWRGYRDMVHAGSEDFHNEIVELVCEDHQAAARLRYTGTHTGALINMPATNRHFEYVGAAFFVADGVRLRSAWVLGDLDGLRRQLAN